jgi:hypothetical protein
MEFSSLASLRPFRTGGRTGKAASDALRLIFCPAACVSSAWTSRPIAPRGTASSDGSWRWDGEMKLSSPGWLAVCFWKEPGDLHSCPVAVSLLPVWTRRPSLSRARRGTGKRGPVRLNRRWITSTTGGLLPQTHCMQHDAAHRTQCAHATTRQGQGN